jgi:hypothetical protein
MHDLCKHLRDFTRFEMYKSDLDRQQEDRILVVEKEILHEKKITIEKYYDYHHLPTN